MNYYYQEEGIENNNHHQCTVKRAESTKRSRWYFHTCSAKVSKLLQKAILKVIRNTIKITEKGRSTKFFIYVKNSW